MPYAVLQTDLNTPSVEQLQRAARFVPGLTAGDGHVLGNDAFGILVKDFSEQQAGALQANLRAEGVETEIVEQSFLPQLPPIKFVHRLECSSQHLMIHDPLGRAFPVEWRNIMLIAAGSVRLSKFVSKVKARVSAGKYHLPVSLERENPRGTELSLPRGICHYRRRAALLPQCGKV